MNRRLSLFVGPEAVATLLMVASFVICKQHASYSESDVRTLETVIWLLPVVTVPLTFATIAVPGAKTVGWLVRANVAVLVCLMVGAYFIVSGFGAPGSGPKGQDAGLILAVSLGAFFSAIASTICGVLILRVKRPQFDGWFRRHPVIGPLLTVVATVPVVFAQIIATGTVVGVIGAFVTMLIP